MTLILVVEDEEFNRDMITRRLERQNYKITIALDGAEAIEVAHSEIPDLILMDIGLPEMDGLEAARQLKDAPETRHIPIIALTAHAFETDRDASLAAGCDDFDTKPVDFARLLSKIQALLG